MRIIWTEVQNLHNNVLKLYKNMNYSVKLHNNIFKQWVSIQLGARTFRVDVPIICTLLEASG